MLIRCLVLAMLLVGSAVAEPLTGPQRAAQVAESLVGKPVPDLKLRSIDGGLIDLASYRGKQAVYLKFWATWCKPCVAQMPHFQHAHSTAGSDLAVIGINLGLNDTPKSVQDFQRQQKITMPMAIDDGSAAAALNVRVTPMHVVIDRAGIVQFVSHAADARVDAALASAKIPTATLATAAAQRGGSAIKYQVGSTVQALELQPFDAPPLRVPAASGQPTVLAFFSSWCESYLADTRPQMSARCRRAREQLSSIPAEVRSKAQWAWIASGVWTSDDELSAYDAKFDIDAPLVVDTAGTWFNGFDVRDVPAVIVIGGDGIIRQRLRGDESDLQQRLRSAIEGQR
jgi:peroxiredoxin